MRYQPAPWLFFNLDANYAHARSIDEESGNNFIPLAPDFTILSSINIINDSGIYGNLKLRYLDSRPATEDNSIVAEGYTVVDGSVGYQWGQFDIGVQIQNLFDVDWDETQFATESRLQNEAAPVEEIHFTQALHLC